MGVGKHKNLNNVVLLSCCRTSNRRSPRGIKLIIIIIIIIKQAGINTRGRLLDRSLAAKITTDCP
jgi:hypothetical protein